MHAVNADILRLMRGTWRLPFPAALFPQAAASDTQDHTIL